MNPHGLHDEDHYTTAYDLYLIFNEALKYPEFRTVTGSTAYTANYTNKAGESISKTWRGGNWYLTGAVSYTHLDVYTRQLWNYPTRQPLT